jgi:hypothetical protein
MTMITPSYLGETIEYSSLHACRSTLEDPTKEAKPRQQEKIDSKAVTDELIQISVAMSDKTFTATINERCRSCAVKSSCPIQPQGRSVINNGN